MLVLAIGNWTLRTLVDQLRQWAMQSPEHLTIVIAAGFIALVASLYVGLRLSRWLGRSFLGLSIWMAATMWDVVADAIRRWRTPTSSATPPAADTTASTTPAAENREAEDREYLRIRPTSAEYDPETLIRALSGLHSTHRRTELSGTWRRTDQDVLEFLVATRGADTGVEFYLGGTMSLDRLAAALPYRQCGFDVDRVSTHPARLLDPRMSDESETDSPTDVALTADISAPSARDPETAADGGAAVATEECITEDVADANASAADPTDALLAHLTDRGCEPVVYRLNTQARRWKDWMTSRPGLTDMRATPSDGPSMSAGQAAAHPLIPVIEAFDELDGPAMYHVAWRPFRTWGAQADMREHRLTTRRDTLGQRVGGFVDHFLDSLEGNYERRREDRRQHDRRRTTTSPRDRHATLPRADRERLDHLDEADTNNTAVVNVRFAAIPTAEESRADVATTVRDLGRNLDHLDGDYYQLATPLSARKERITGLLHVRGARHRQRLRRLCHREVKTPALGHTRFNLRKWWPDIVCTPDELAALTAIPSTATLPDAVTEHLPHRPAHTDPQEGLPPAIRERYVRSNGQGVRLGYLLKDDGKPALDKPVRIPVGDLQHHAIELGASGTGKSTDVAIRANQYPETTEGPVIILTGPGANVGRYTMRALAARHDLDWVEDHVHWFPVPSVVPGVAPLNLEAVQARDDVDERWDAVTEIRDQVVAILRRLMGSEAYDEAQWSTRVINRCIEAAFDPEYWEANAPAPPRPGPDACRFEHVRAVLNQLAEAGQDEAAGARPRLSTDDDQTFEQVLQFSDPVFGNIIGGAYGRLDAISDDRRRRLLFASLEPELSFADILDSNDVYIFDLSALQDDPQQLMALTLVTLLNNALEAAHGRGWLQEQPSEYLVNVVVDEAAFVAGSEYFSQLLAEGRNYRIGLDLATQYLEQFEDEVDGGAMRNVIANTDTKLVGTHTPSDRLAEVLQPETLNVTEVRQLVRDLPESHRVALLPRQADTERPQLLTVHRGPLPAWHPESDASPFDEDAFEASLDRIRERTQEQYGVTDEVRRGVYEGWETPDGDAAEDVAVAAGDDRPLEVAMAEAIRTVQLHEDVREANGWVPVEAVDQELLGRLDEDDPEEQLYERFPDVRQGSGLIDVDLSEDASTVRCRLTDAGEDAAAPDTSSVPTGGGEEHDTALEEIERALTTHGFSVQILDQHGEERPDAIATHPDLQHAFHVEVETTTHNRPAKILTNLRKAQDAGRIPLFVVGTDQASSGTDIAERLANILREPRNRLSTGETRLYTTNDDIDFHGGATAPDGVAAVRPATDDSRHTRWYQRDGAFVLEDGTGAEHTRLTDFETMSKDQFPATYSYDDSTGTYTVFTPGELPETYESKDAFETDWVPVKRPFVPETDLPTPDYTERSYAIVIITDAGGDSEVVVYDSTDGTIRQLSALRDAVTAGDLHPAGVTGTGSNLDRQQDEQGDEADPFGLAAFTTDVTTERPDHVIAVAEVYEAYERFAAADGYEVKPKPQFTQALQDHVAFERDKRWLDGKERRCYVGIDLQQRPAALASDDSST